MIVLQTNAPSEWAMFLGHFHPVVVHLPIGMLVIAAILEWFSRRKNGLSLQPAIAPILFVGSLTAIVSCILGYLLSSSGEYNEDTLFWHQWMGIAVATISLMAWYLKIRGSEASRFNYLYLSSIYSMLLLLTITGHLGGNMTHGEDYLYASMPEPFRSLFGLPERATNGSTRKPIANINEALVYQDIVAPVMEQKCWSCHNANKIKGELRMDKQDLLMKGGKSGAIIKANDPTNSELIKRLLLPEEDEHHMPPKGKNPLTQQEIALLHWWIQNGASFDKKVIQLKQDEKLKPYLASLTTNASNQGGESGESVSAVFKEKVSAADEKDIQKLNALQVIVMPVASGQNFLQANFVNARNFNDSQVELLNNLSDQIIWMKLGGTQITDKSLSVLGKFSHLTRLHLEHTAITDAGLVQLQDLKFLEYLNLFDTNITDAGIQALAKIKSLKNVYCWKTKVSKSGIQALHKALPHVEIHTGWEDSKPISSKD